MSGCGALATDAVVAAALAFEREAERKACAAFIRAKGAEVQSIARKGGCDADAADMLIHRLAAIADSIDARLHLGELS